MDASVGDMLQAPLLYRTLCPPPGRNGETTLGVDGPVGVCPVVSTSSVHPPGQVDLAAQRPLLAEQPDVVVGTPARVLAHLQARNLDLKAGLELLVVDEADLVFSYGHEEDVHEILRRLPPICQTILTSATLSPEVMGRCIALFWSHFLLRFFSFSRNDFWGKSPRWRVFILSKIDFHLRWSVTCTL